MCIHIYQHNIGYDFGECNELDTQCLQLIDSLSSPDNTNVFIVDI